MTCSIRTFGYDPDTRVGQNPGEETLILHRYRILWNISVDSRLIAMGKEPMLSEGGSVQRISVMVPKNSSRPVEIRV